MQNLIEVKDLYHRYEDGQKMRAVLKDINITFEAGKLYAVVGSSGSGKTTLLSLLSGLDSVQDGDITYLDESIGNIGYTKYRKEFVNVIFQAYNLINYMTALQNVLKELRMQIFQISE